MTKIFLNLDFAAIKNRINLLKQDIAHSQWAEIIGVNSKIVTNVHGSYGQQPSIEYIIAVARATKTPLEYLLWGDQAKLAERYNIAETVAEYGCGKHKKLVKMTIEILDSKTKYAKHLAEAIRLYHGSIIGRNDREETSTSFKESTG